MLISLPYESGIIGCAHCRRDDDQDVILIRGLVDRLISAPRGVENTAGWYCRVQTGMEQSWALAESSADMLIGKSGPLHRMG